MDSRLSCGRKGNGCRLDRDDGGGDPDGGCNLVSWNFDCNHSGRGHCPGLVPVVFMDRPRRPNSSNIVLISLGRFRGEYLLDSRAASSIVLIMGVDGRGGCPKRKVECQKSELHFDG